ncbi:transposase [Streptomyces chilikensis]|uniref:transposase n=1 Tax=Streptomyces chilikensis TaxID=1194079 RepID=UPI003F4D1EA5
MVERLVPNELWELFRHGDREVLAAIVFVATSGFTWQQMPTVSFSPSGATAHRRFTEWTEVRIRAGPHRLVLD